MNHPHSHSNYTHPTESMGYLYYARLSSPLGTFYKLGFTTMGSVQERLAFQGRGHDALVDVVLMFAYREDAYAVEQLLHSHFRNKAMFTSLDEDMPLFGNGQSELYVEDILGLDWGNKNLKKNIKYTENNVIIQKGRRLGSTDENLRKQLKIRDKRADTTTELERLLCWIFRIYDKFGELNASFNEKTRKARVKSVLAEVKDHGNNYWKAWFQRRTAISNNPYEGLKTDVRQAIAALKRKDLHSFENLIHVPLTVRNLADAMTADLMMPSDYMGVANNCGLEELMEAMTNDNCRDLLLWPVENDYKTFLRSFVRNHQLPREDLTMPKDSMYTPSFKKFSNGISSTLSDYFAPRKFLELFGREWDLPDDPYFTEKPGTVSFQVGVINNVTGFKGFLTVEAMYVANSRIALFFPNLLDMEEAACAHRHVWEKSIGLGEPCEQGISAYSGLNKAR